MEQVTIRRETDADIPAIESIISSAFEGSEARIVEKLRDTDSLSVSLVAVVDRRIVGHVAASPVTIEDGTGGWFGIGPLAVEPPAQRRGIGSMLMKSLLDALSNGGAGGAVVLGEPAYYRRFNFVLSEALTYPDAPADHFLALRLGDSRFPSGVVTYHPAFG